MLGSPWDKLVILAIVTSAVASTQTTIIPASRTSFSMARADALPRGLAAIHPRFRTPHVSTIVVAALAISLVRPRELHQRELPLRHASALALMIAFYYALSGLACVVYYRRELTRSVKNFVFIGVAPLVGAAMLGYLFIEAVRSFADPEASYTGQQFLGLGVPLVIGLGFLLLGAVIMVLWRLGGHERFFSRKPLEKADPELVGVMATIVLGYDGSGCARCALKVALELCKTLGDRLVIAYAFEPPGKLVGEEFKEHRQAPGGDRRRHDSRGGRARPRRGSPGSRRARRRASRGGSEPARRAVRRANDRRREPG